MIHFFRRIRQSLLEGNKPASPAGRFRKYLIYAIGEIALVMIGILLALQVNIWNENRKSQNQESQALIDLYKEFSQSVVDLGSLQKTRIQQENQFRDYYILITNERIPAIERATSTFPSTYDGVWDPNTNMLEGMISSGAIDNIKNDSLKSLLTLWPNRVSTYSHFENEVLTVLHDMNAYTGERVPQRIVKSGDYSWSLSKWPGEYYPHDLKEKRDIAMTDVVNEVRFQNYISVMTNRLYVNLIVVKRLLADAEVIERLIVKELHSRHLEIPEIELIEGAHE